MKKNLAFTLAEVLITLAIIGVVAAMTIPSVIVNTNQSEFKTGLRKAVSVLNQAITMNGALEGETPADNENLFAYLQQHMSVMSSTRTLPWKPKYGGTEYENLAFYTTDGMRFEIPVVTIEKTIHEQIGGGSDDNKITFNTKTAASFQTGELDENGTEITGVRIGKCGSQGYKTDSDTNSAPCLILVDVNGDRKPTPASVNQNQRDVSIYLAPQPSDKLIKDIFTIIVTDEKAIPYGVSAQKAMYQARQK